MAGSFLVKMAAIFGIGLPLRYPFTGSVCAGRAHGRGRGGRSARVSAALSCVTMGIFWPLIILEFADFVAASLGKAKGLIRYGSALSFAFPVGTKMDFGLHLRGNIDPRWFAPLSKPFSTLPQWLAGSDLIMAICVIWGTEMIVWPKILRKGGIEVSGKGDYRRFRHTGKPVSTDGDGSDGGRASIALRAGIRIIPRFRYSQSKRSYTGLESRCPRRPGSRSSKHRNRSRKRIRCKPDCLGNWTKNRFSGNSGVVVDFEV